MAKRTSNVYLIFIASCVFLVKFINTEDAAESVGDPSSWPGHMEALGSKNVKHDVPKLEEFPEPQEFFREYVGPGKPVFIKNGAKISPAFHLWTDDYFVSLPGADNITVTVEQGKKENRTFPADERSFKDFVIAYNKSDIYMVNGVPDILQKDVLLPPSLLCEDLTPHLVDTVMWFSSGGTKSVFHHDDVDNINCLYSGSKVLLFVDYQKYKNKLHLDNAWGGFSGVDIDHVNYTKYPIFRDVEFYEAKMESGDCLFIPFKWYHQVTSTGRNIAVNIWWKHLHSFVPSKCDKMEKGATLDKFNFSSLENEKGANAEDSEEEEGGLLEMLAKRLRSGKELTLDGFVNFLKEGILTEFKPEFDGDILEFVGQVFQFGDIDKDGILTFEDVQNMDDKTFSVLENDIAELEGILGEFHDPMYVNSHHEEL